MRSARLFSVLVVFLAMLFAGTGCGKSKTVRVPNVRGEELTKAYSVLHKAGLKVSFGVSLTYSRRFGLSPDSSYIGVIRSDFGLSAPSVVSQRPRAGSIVVRGSTVTLDLPNHWIGEMDELRCKSQPETAPDLIGRTLSEALSYEDHCLAFSVEKIPPLEAGDQAHLFDNYLVKQQSPAPDATFPPISASNPPGYTTLTVTVVAK